MREGDKLELSMKLIKADLLMAKKGEGKNHAEYYFQQRHEGYRRQKLCV